MSSANSNTAELGARMTMSEVGKQKAAESDIHDFLREHPIQVLKPQMATQAKVYYAGLDGSVR